MEDVIIWSTVKAHDRELELDRGIQDSLSESTFGEQRIHLLVGVVIGQMHEVRCSVASSCNLLLKVRLSSFSCKEMAHAFRTGVVLKHSDAAFPCSKMSSESAIEKVVSL